LIGTGGGQIEGRGRNKRGTRSTWLTSREEKVEVILERRERLKVARKAARRHHSGSSSQEKKLSSVSRPFFARGEELAKAETFRKKSEEEGKGGNLAKNSK